MWPGEASDDGSSKVDESPPHGPYSCARPVAGRDRDRLMDAFPPVVF